MTKTIDELRLKYPKLSKTNYYITKRVISAGLKGSMFNKEIKLNILEEIKFEIVNETNNPSNKENK